MNVPIPMAARAGGFERLQSSLGGLKDFSASLRKALRRALPLRSPLVCLLLIAPASLRALDAEKSIFQFNLQNWTAQGGLPSARIESVIQTKEGFIWLASSAGVARFDGQEFMTVHLDQLGHRLLPAQWGGFWLETKDGRPARFDGKQLRDVGHGPSTAGETALFESRDGAVWTGSDSGFTRWAGPNFDGVATKLENAGPVSAFCEDASGQIWMGTPTGGLFVWAGGKLRSPAAPTEKIPPISALAADRGGRIWIGTHGGLYLYNRTGKVEKIPGIEAEVQALLVDRNGVVWAGTAGAGLAHYQNGTLSILSKTDGLAGDSVTSLFEDYEGSLWVGTGEGLTQISDIKFPLFSDKEGLPGGSIHTVVASRKGGLWAATMNGFTHLDGHTVTNYNDAALFPNVYVQHVFEARNGDIYISDGDKTISVFSGHQLIERFPCKDWPEGFAEDDESVLVGIGPALYRIKGSELKPFQYKTDPAPAYNWIQNLTLGSDGAIWVASVNGVFRVKDGAVRQWSVAEGLSSERINFIFEDEDGSIWVGTDTGLARIKNSTVKNIAGGNGLPDVRIYAITADDRGYFWFSSGRGIFRVSRSDLNECADGRSAQIRAELFNGPESVKTTDRTDQGLSCCKTSDGRIWMPSPRGVIMIDPAGFFTNKIPPRVVVEEIRDKSSRQNEGPSHRRGGVRQIEFSFAALSYIAPKKIQVRYRLTGSDSSWIDGGTRHSVRYTNLPAGKYKFQVQARNADGVWNTEGGEFALELLPPFYQTGWFYGTTGGALALLLVGGYRWKVRRLRLLQRKLQADNDALEAKVAARTQELAREHALLRTLLNSSPDQIYFKDAQSRYLKASQAQAENFGLATAEELVGLTDSDFLSEEHARPSFEEEQAIMRTGDPVIGKIEKVIHKDGREEWLLTSKMPFRNEVGAITGTFGVSKNITAIKEAEARLEQVHKQLLDTSRQAGMAEVATSVLHNVGNVLNSANVSASLMVEDLRKSKVRAVGKIAQILEENTSNLATFLTDDPKGKKIVPYLAALGEELAAGQDKMTEELFNLRQNIEHIKEIVAMQQNLAKVGGIKETVLLPDIVEDALRIHAPEFGRNGVKIIRDYRAGPSVTVERHKVLQILVNLIQNARHACEERSETGGQMTVQITENGVAQISIIDNGIGIPPENLTRIFSHGFTTKKGGHGFGLHSSVLAAKELGGTLRAISEGPGHGATFTLEFPPDEADGSA